MSGFLWSTKEEREKDPTHVGLVQLAFPILLESLLRSTVNLVDVVFMSRISDSVVSAVSVASQYIILCMIIASAVATGTMVCINQAIGMHNQSRVNRLASIAVAANLCLGILFGIIFFCFSDIFLLIMKLEPSSIANASQYMKICGGLMVISCVEIVLNNICRSMGHTRAPLVINLTINLINLVGDYLVVFHPEIIPVDPVVGVAFASVFGRLGGLLLSIWIIAKTSVRISPKQLRPFPKEELMLSLSIGIPGGLNNLAYTLSQLVTTSIISLTGDVMVATKVYATNLINYIALVGMAFAQAATIMVGYRIGAGNYEEANQIRSLVTRIALLSNAFFSLVLIAGRMPLMRFFTDDPTILRIASTIFLIDFAVEIGRALNNTLAGSLQAAGDVTFQLVINQASGWLVSVAGSYLFAIVFGWGLYGVWIAFALDELTRGLILLYRWKSRKWMKAAEKRRQILARQEPSPA
ncbi:MAG: MATE family efflux transporter [Clostridia bacterium]|nr:MATE family efflux transporter [Clostridia bacterium]